MSALTEGLEVLKNLERSDKPSATPIGYLPPVWIRTKSEPYMYIHEVRGVCYLSWVMEQDKANAALFPDNQHWLYLLSKMTGYKLEKVKPFV